ncbi:MAG: hypothetical protein Q4B54_08830 [Coriobacteriales bacterium]|nr:hypothetical protein [Coriobacteriales bacterium]
MDMANEWADVEVSRVDAQDILNDTSRALSGCAASLVGLSRCYDELPAGYEDALLMLSEILDKSSKTLHELSGDFA